MTTIDRATPLTLEGHDGRVSVTRDAYGIAHVEAPSTYDAFFGQGYAAVVDRLWQMEYDRRRAAGRWAEAAGKAGLAADVMARRLGLEAAARADVEGMGAETRAMFEAYAAGVNAFLDSSPALPPEYALTGISPEPWEPWHSVALFKVRHALMGLWQSKMALAGLRARIGAERWAQLRFLPALGSSLIVPPGGAVSRLFDHANAEIAAAAEHLGFLSEVDGGSNSWVVHGTRTTTGKPVICNDSHRALDVPNAYWQVHLKCPEFDVAGATFAGFPGFQHFGFNGDVAWNITHTQADYQDLYIERFEGAGGERYATKDGLRDTEVRSETIAVRGGEPVTIQCWTTHHGPIVHGDPREGTGIALKYTALQPGRQPFEAIAPMLRSKTVDELFDQQRTWVDPVNNLVAADSAGNIGYMVRGELPVRASTAGRLIAVPGWTGEHEWTGSVPFEELPRSTNPGEGFFGTANQRVIAGDEPYISEFFATPGRANRIAELLAGDAVLAPETIAWWQGDTTSVFARRWAEFLATFEPFDAAAEQSRALLAAWDGNLRGDGAEGLVYALFRRALMRELFVPLVGEEAWSYLTSEANPGLGRVAGGMMAAVVAGLDSEPLAPGGREWRSVLEPALTRGWQAATEMFGPESGTWRWAARHTTASKHPLSAIFPETNGAYDPPRAAVGGDADTLQCAGFGGSGRNDFVITGTSVYRQVVDFADPASASYVIPGGASGDPRSPHFADQLPLWERHERVPMRPGEGG